jgi:hypothetical protein
MSKHEDRDRPLPISNTGLGRTRGGQASGSPAPAQAATPTQPEVPAGDPRLQTLLGKIDTSLKELAQQPAKPIMRPILSPLNALD